MSTQRTVAAPSVSMAGMRRVSTRLREIRQAPRARKIVSTTGNSSGRIGHGHRDAGQQALFPDLRRAASGEGIDDDHNAAGRQPTMAKRADQPPRLLLQRRRLGLDLLQRLPNLAEFGAAARAHDLGDALARGDQSPGVHGWQIVAARPFELLRVRRRRLPHRDRFSGKERFVDG